MALIREYDNLEKALQDFVKFNELLIRSESRFKNQDLRKKLWVATNHMNYTYGNYDDLNLMVEQLLEKFKHIEFLNITIELIENKNYNDVSYWKLIGRIGETEGSYFSYLIIEAKVLNFLRSGV